MWRWAKQQLLVRTPGLRADPPGIHQLAIAPQWGGWRPGPAAATGQGAAARLRVWSEEASLTLVTVGAGNAPKFWSLVPPQTPQRDPWTFPLGKVGA